MFKALNPWAIGVKVKNLAENISAARRGGFDGVEFNAPEVADLADKQGIAGVKQMFSDAGVKPAGWSLPLDWRGEDAKFKKEFEGFPRIAKAAAQLSNRCFIWIMPASNDLNMEANRRFHVDRLKPIAKVLKENNCQLGLEFIGPKTIRDAHKYPFIYKMEDMLALGKEIGTNVGLLLDCWHWYTSGGIIADLHSLSPKQVVYVHVNDAPKGIAIDKQMDDTRDLPGATGVIDIKGFLKALDSIGYEGPVVAEPFKKDLANLPSDEARLKVVKDSLDRVFESAGLS